MSERFTQFNAFIAMMFNESKYTFRFYEFCCQWRKKVLLNLPSNKSNGGSNWTGTKTVVARL